MPSNYEVKNVTKLCAGTEGRHSGRKTKFTCEYVLLAAFHESFLFRKLTNVLDISITEALKLKFTGLSLNLILLMQPRLVGHDSSKS